jgi:hypothetical protein
MKFHACLVLSCAAQTLAAAAAGRPAVTSKKLQEAITTKK